MNVLGLSVTSSGKDPLLNLAAKEFVKIIANSSQDQSILKEINTKYSFRRALRWSLSSSTLAIWWEEPTHWKKTEMLGKIEGKRRRKAAEDEMVGWHHQLNGNDVEQTPGDSGGQRSLVCAVHVVSKSCTGLVTKQQLRLGAQTGNSGLKLLETKGWGILRHRISVNFSSQENWPHRDFWSKP